MKTASTVGELLGIDGEITTAATTTHENHAHPKPQRRQQRAQRAARSPVQAVHIVGPFAVLVPVSVVHHQHLLLRLQHFLKDAEKRNSFNIRPKKKKRTFCSSPTSRQESSPCTTAARDSQETPWSLCITFRPKAPGTLRTRRRYHWYRKSGINNSDHNEIFNQERRGRRPDRTLCTLNERTLDFAPRRHRTAQL